METKNNYLEYEELDKDEKVTLTEEQAERFVKKFCEGEIWGFYELDDILRKELKLLDNKTYYTVFDTLGLTIKMNSLKVMSEDYEELDEEADLIDELYAKMKQKLFDSFTNDFYPIFEKYCW